MNRFPSILDSVRAQGVDFLHQGKRIEHDAIADYASASLAQHAARNQLKDEFLSFNGDRVAGIVPAGIARHDVEPFGENVYDFAFALVAPLRADDDRRLASFQLATPIQGDTAAR